MRAAVARQMEGQPEAEIEKRADTLTHVVYRTAWVAGFAIAVLTVLPDVGINIGPLLVIGWCAGMTLLLPLV